MPRTARASILLCGGAARPRSSEVIVHVREALIRPAGSDPAGAVRFVGYDSTLIPANAPAGTRAAVYEADFA